MTDLGLIGKTITLGIISCFGHRHYCPYLMEALCRIGFSEPATCQGEAVLPLAPCRSFWFWVSAFF